MIHLDTRALVPRLKTIESLALIPRVASTNLIARRIVAECVENDLSLPQAIIIAGEQLAGRGRNERRWSSPPGKGIYATTIVSRPARELPLIPLAVANALAVFLRDAFGIDARIKWPNDILVGTGKIAGILIEARVQADRAFLVIGTGINVEPVEDDERPSAVAISEVASRGYDGIDGATAGFIEHLDEHLARPLSRDEVLGEWRRLTTHRAGDRIHCVLPGRTIDGTWVEIDDSGRAVMSTVDGRIEVSAGDIVLRS